MSYLGNAGFIALADSAKAIVSYRVGKRNGENTRAFLADLRDRVLGAPEISSDAFSAYPDAVERAFGNDCRFGTIEKHYATDPGLEAARRYSPAVVVAVSRQRVVGFPRHIATSYVERQNLTLRMGQKRFARLSNGFSKKLREPRGSREPLRGALQSLPGPPGPGGSRPQWPWT